MKSTDQILLEAAYERIITEGEYDMKGAFGKELIVPHLDQDRALLNSRRALAKRKNLYTLKQDEQSVYAPVPKSLGSTEFYKKRFSLFDSEGNELPPTTPLQAGQIVNREFGVYFKVNKEGEEFVAEPSKLTPEVKNNIEKPRAERIAQDKEELKALGRPSY